MLRSSLVHSFVDFNHGLNLLGYDAVTDTCSPLLSRGVVVEDTLA